MARNQPYRIEPEPGQESVWDYPRPPRVEPTRKHIQVVFNEVILADSHRTLRVLETSSPPVYYIPQGDILLEYLEPAVGSTFCEWKGRAAYFHVRVGDRRAEQAAWQYPSPQADYVSLRDHIAFYPRLMDACLVDGEKALPQPGDFYGGWITRDIVGPFKGEPGTLGW